jgi:murein DD-endopeptidase MepM/ murein hydrolase activator NlpD
MPEEHRSFTLTSPTMQGGDVKRWEEILNAQFDEWKVEFQVPVDGEYTPSIREASAMVLFGLGIKKVKMKHGISHDLRMKVRDKSLTPTEKKTRRSRRPWRQFQRRKYADGGVCSPVSKIFTDANGFTGAEQEDHDGVDLICPENAPIFAICRAKVIDVRTSGWCGATENSGGHAVSEGDGIIQLKGLADNGPFRKGMHFGYGHAEHATVEEGDIVEAGQQIGKAGFANAWHVHFMVNDGTTTLGIGDCDPKPFVDYAKKYG